MDPQVLGGSAAFAAAKFAIALWFGQLTLMVLDRRRAALSWQIMLSAATIVASWWAVRASGVPFWWTPAWVSSSLLAAAALIDCVRRWISAPAASERAVESSPTVSITAQSVVSSQASQAGGGSQRVYDLICLVGWAVTTTASEMAVLAELPPGTLVRAAAVMQTGISAFLLGIVLVVSFELTIGATGATLLNLNWRRLGQITTPLLLFQLAISVLVILFRRDGATPVESLTPIVFALGMAIGGYIVWAIPRQMISLAAKGQMRGQASLAVAAWLAVICLAVACGLPATWPWAQMDTASIALPIIP